MLALLSVYGNGEGECAFLRAVLWCGCYVHVLCFSWSECDELVGEVCVLVALECEFVVFGDVCRVFECEVVCCFAAEGDDL